MTRRTAAVRALALVLVVAAAFVAWWVWGPDLEQVRAGIQDAGAWAPALYVAVHALLTLLPVPKNALAVLGGAIFGAPLGVALSWTAALVSGVAAFGLGRALGRDAVVRLGGERTARVDAALGDHGLTAVVVARLTPVVPFALVNYVAGASRVRWRDFVAGSAVGVLPGTIAYAVLGASGASGPVPLLLGGSLAVLLLVASWAMARRRRGGSRLSREGCWPGAARRRCRGRTRSGARRPTGTRPARRPASRRCLGRRA